MEKELVELFESAKKAADVAAANGISSSDPAVSRCVDALKVLKKLPVTYDVLVSTQIGKRLRHITKHPREAVRAVASDLLEVWKKIVIDETISKRVKGSIENHHSNTVVEKLESPINKKKKGSIENHHSKTVAEKLETSIKTETVKIESTHQTVSPKPGIETMKAEKTKTHQAELVKVEKRIQSSTAPPKLSSMVKCNDALRDKIRELLLEALSKVAGEADEERKDEIKGCDPIRVTVAVESVMFEKLGRSNGAQKHKYRSIMFNLKDGNNPDLRRRVLLGQIRGERLISMSAEEMASDQRQRENEQIKERALFDCERGGAAKATTDQFKCGRCGQRKCTYYQMQTRSADEPMTTYVTCVNCNNHWKFC